MSNGRTSPRSPGRTPPFILVGLLVLVCVSAYNYWTLTAKNSELTARAEKLELELKSASDGSVLAKRSVEEVSEKLRVSEGNLDQVRQALKEREAEVDKIKNEEAKLSDDEKKCKDDLGKCDSELASKGQNMETILAERKALEDEVAALKQKENTCDAQTCFPYVKDVVAVVAKVADPQAVRKALADAQYDPNAIMGPAQNPPQEEAKPQAEAQPDQQPNQQPNPPQEQPQEPNAPKAKEAEAQVNTSPANVVARLEASTPVSDANVSSGKLVFQPDEPAQPNEGDNDEEEGIESFKEAVNDEDTEVDPPEMAEKENGAQDETNNEKKEGEDGEDEHKEGVVLLEEDQSPDEPV